MHLRISVASKSNEPLIMCWNQIGSEDPHDSHYFSSLAKIHYKFNVRIHLPNIEGLIDSQIRISIVGHSNWTLIKVCVSPSVT